MLEQYFLAREPVSVDEQAMNSPDQPHFVTVFLLSQVDKYMTCKKKIEDKKKVKKNSDSFKPFKSTSHLWLTKRNSLRLFHIFV